MLSNTNDNLKVEIDKRTEVQEKLKHLAYHDYLTGLPNRLLFLEELRHAIFLADRSETILSVMFLDLDGFKMINDTMGHAVGDELLIEVAKRLKNTVRKSDGVARIGGDEFVVVFENIKEFDGIKIMTDKVLASFNQPFKINDQEIFVKTSLGVATYPINGNNAETLIQNADIAMYRAKEMGRNQGVIYTPLMENNINEYMRLSNQLYRALDRRELLLYYQPQVDCNTNEVIGMEALIRWNHPDLGLVLPARFIPIAERTGLIHSIGEWVIRTACNQNKAWQDAGLKKIPIAVNLSVLQFTDPFIVEKTAMILRECGLQPQYLEVEITESVIMKEMRSILDALNSFKRLGISISVDDFGTEYSSLQYLKELPVDKLKIAMPFVQGAEENDTDKAIINAILLLAEKTGMRVIAEGVETEEQLSFLVDSKCKEAQGFHFFRPLPADQMEKLLREGIGSQEG
jgi:diguanylate cyclase (GGDEF)-like protein